MEHRRPNFYRRVRCFCELPLNAVSLATGIPTGRLGAIETGRVTPNGVERRLIESFLRDKLKIVLESEPVPDWLARKSDSSSSSTGLLA
jgi:hypothetical protein